MTKAKCNQTNTLNLCSSFPSFVVATGKHEICREKTAFWLRLKRLHFCGPSGRGTEQFQRSLKHLAGEATSINCSADRGEISNLLKFVSSLKLLMDWVGQNFNYDSTIWILIDLFKIEIFVRIWIYGKHLLRVEHAILQEKEWEHTV